MTPKVGQSPSDYKALQWYNVWLEHYLEIFLHTGLMAPEWVDSQISHMREQTV